MTFKLKLWTACFAIKKKGYKRYLFRLPNLTACKIKESKGWMQS